MTANRTALGLSPSILLVKRGDGAVVVLGERSEVPMVLNRTAANWLELILESSASEALSELAERYNDAPTELISSAFNRVLDQLLLAGVLVPTQRNEPPV